MPAYISKPPLSPGPWEWPRSSYWPMIGIGEDGGDYGIRDVWGDRTLTSGGHALGRAPVRTHSRYGDALDYTGGNRELSTAHHASFDVTSAGFTFLCLTITSASHTGNLWTKRLSDGSSQVTLGVAGASSSSGVGGLKRRIYLAHGGVVRGAYTTADVSDGAPHVEAYVYHPGQQTIQVWIDGIPVAMTNDNTGGWPLPVNTAAVYVGAREPITLNFSGILSGCAWIGRALSGVEIAAWVEDFFWPLRSRPRWASAVAASGNSWPWFHGADLAGGFDGLIGI